MGTGSRWPNSGRWTQKWPSKFSCGLGSQRRRNRPNSKFSSLRPNFNNNWQKLAQKFVKKFFTALLQMIWGVAGLRPNFFSSGLIFLTGLAQESWRDLAAVKWGHFKDSKWSWQKIETFRGARDFCGPLNSMSNSKVHFWANKKHHFWQGNCKINLV